MSIQIVKFDPSSQKKTKDIAKKAADFLKTGGLVIHPTDTCYGLAADFRNRQAIKNIYLLKGRDFSKPLFIIVKNIVEFKKYGFFKKIVRDIILKYPNSQFTFVVERKKNVPNFLNPGISTIGIQIPKGTFSRELLGFMRGPVIGTSANISGGNSCYSIEDIKKNFKSAGKIPLLVLDGGKSKKINPSSVISIKNNNSFEIIRSGDIKKIEIP